VSALVTGSSPRTRGTQSASRTRRPGSRFIPAYTGNSSSCGSSRSYRAVHPRVHGELFRSRPPVHLDGGSSPRTRGTLSHNTRWHEDDRFIPAYTGNSSPPARSVVCRPVHPRVHGELSCQPGSLPPPFGSSPRTRGTQVHPQPRFWRNRFIPAYTGNSRCPAASRWRWTVHPRVHGELEVGREPGIVPRGSSPRTRGTHPVAGQVADMRRFIPAYTGNSS